MRIRVVKSSSFGWSVWEGMHVLAAFSRWSDAIAYAQRKAITG